MIATGFKDTPRNRDNATAASAVLNRVPQVRAPHLGANLGETATFQVPSVREPEPGGPCLPDVGKYGEVSGAPSSGERLGSGPRITERPRTVPYIPDPAEDLDLESEIVRHAEPVEDARTAATYSREAESTYASMIKGAPMEEPPSIETVSSSVNINYDADDLEIPAFLRKRGEN